MPDDRNGDRDERSEGILRTRIAPPSKPEFETAEPPRRRPVLIVQRGAEIGRRYLLNEFPLVVGRHPRRADLLLAGDTQVSGRHLRLDSDGDGVTLVDLDSTNGTRLGSQICSPGETRGLQPGDRVHVGDTVLRFDLQDLVDEHFHDEIHRRMNVDDLTGLPVKRVFDRNLEWAVAAARSHDHSLVVLMIDMDGLKRINDTFGHHVGAASIAEVGHRIGARIGGRGNATRFGGDEFTVYLEQLARNEGLTWADALRAEIEGEMVQVEGVEARPTLSIGLASLPQDGDRPKKLVRAADAALYRAKAAGRNRVAE